MKPVFNTITVIEERKKTPEYEGFTREVSATGIMELEGISCMESVAVAVGAGGVLDRDGKTQHSNKIIIGDNFGNIHLFDASRKLVLDKK